MDKRLLLAVVLSVLVVVGYQEYLRIYYPQSGRTPPRASPRTPSASPTDGAAATTPPVAGVPQSLPEIASGSLPEGDIRVETDAFVATISSRGGRLTSLALKNYRVSVDPASPPLEMVAPAGGDLPLGVVLRGERTSSDRDVVYEPSSRTLSVTGEDEGVLVLRGTFPAGETIEKRFVFRGALHAFDVGVDVSREIAGVREAALAWTHRKETSEDQHFVGGEALVGKKLLYMEDEELAEGVIFPDPRDASKPSGPVQWGGYADSYFLSAIAPNSEEAVRLWMKLRDGAITTEVLVPMSVVANAEPEFTVYVGPKDLDHLTPPGHHLSRALDLGWFSLLAEVLLRVLKAFHRFTGNYGVDIVLLTVLIKALFIPLTQKSFKSMQAMQKVQPEMKKLQERFKDDREALNREMMELYKRHKVNPLGGCLPMLLQMPVFIGLYNALFYAVELRHAPFALWINDLSAPDRLPAFPAAPIAELFGFDIRIPVLTLLMGASMLVQQRMTPAMGDPMQQRMMMLMPVVFTVMFVSFPSGLVLYWLINNVLTIAQQATIQRQARA